MRRCQVRLIVAVLALVTSLIVLIGMPPDPALARMGDCCSGCATDCPSSTCENMGGDCDECGGPDPICPIPKWCPLDESYWWCPDE